MKAQLHVPLGGKRLVIEGDGNQQSIVKALSFWSGLPSKCTACGSTDISLSYRCPSGYDYYGLRCDKCNATLNFGQNKDGSGFFIKSDSKWEVYTPKGKDNKKDDMEF